MQIQKQEDQQSHEKTGQGPNHLKLIQWINVTQNDIACEVVM